MRYLLLLFLFIVGCASAPARFDAQVTGEYYKPFSSDVYWIEVFSDKYGQIKIYTSPFYGHVKVGDSVEVGCNDVGGKVFGPTGCSILKKYEQNEKGQ